MRTRAWSVKNWSSVAGWSCLAVATLYLTLPLADVAAVKAPDRNETAISAPFTSFDALRFNGHSGAIPE